MDAPRERPAPGGFVGRTLAGREVEVRFARPTVVVAVKPGCDGCSEFVASAVEIPGVDVVVAAAGDDERWESADHVVVAPELWRALEIRSAPFYVLLDPSVGRVLDEGPVFALDQVAEEVTRTLAG